MAYKTSATLQLGLAMLIVAWPAFLSAEETLETVNQIDLNDMIQAEGNLAAFQHAFEAGDELTEFSFTAGMGVGANIGEGRRFTRFPRADLDGPGEWASHFPEREGGANATSCIACHNSPFANGAGDVALNVVVDPAHTGDPTLYLERNTLPLFALGIPQRLAEEISLSLYFQRDAAIKEACTSGIATANLAAKGVSFGQISISRTGSDPCEVAIDTAKLDGIDDDLVVKAFGWKGNHSTIRSFTRGAAHNELGLQAVELVGDADGDFDGVTSELSVGDMTALTLYMAGLERPISTLELAALNLIEMSETEKQDVLWGASLFDTTGCNACHISEMTMDTPVFSEPSTTPGFFDAVFPDGSDPANRALNAKSAVWFDLTRDQPNNVVELENGQSVHLGALRTDENGRAVANWFTDFKRHDMGPELADPSDPLGIGASMWLTRSLAGVGSTGPWLHDGRATTLQEAIIAHGGEAADSRTAYGSLSTPEKAALVAFLESLVIQTLGEEEEDH